jgi:potassium-transporting ATPase potassium-binding subunit
MELIELFPIISFVLIIVISAPLLGALFVRLLVDNADGRSRNFAEDFVFHLIGDSTRSQMSWSQYAGALLASNFVGFLVLLFVLLLQGKLPLNPQSLPGVPIWLAINTAISFVTNTNWQAYSGEATLSYFSQMVGLTTQNFFSAATGITVILAFARGVTSTHQHQIGNFWRDLVRIILYILLPLSAIWAIALVSQGVVQNFSSYITAYPISGGEQLLPMGPAAAQIAIKQLGTNGGGFFGVNSCHPFENPTALSNFLQVLAILLIPAALPFTFGRLVGSPRHGMALFASMLILFLVSLTFSLISESSGNPLLEGMPFMEGKEQRFGIGGSVLWGVATTTASNGSVNSMISSYSPLAGGIALLNMMLGEVVFGGVGSGLYGLLLFAIVTVFIAGLMVGRTPEYLGKKVEAPEIRFAAIGLVLPSAVVLLLSAVAVSTQAGLSSLLHTGPHGLSEILYAFTSAANNNGSAFAGLNSNTPFYNSLLAVAMVLGRYGVLLPVLFIAGRFASKKTIPASLGTFETHGWLFTALLCSIVLIVGALTFFPALCLGPIIEHLLLTQGRSL